MTAKTATAPDEAKLDVRLLHTGQGHGPMNTAHGKLVPGGTLDVPADLATRLLRGYPHIKKAADVMAGAPGAALDDGERKKLEARIKALEEANEKGAAGSIELSAKLDAAEAALAAAVPEALQATLGGLQGVIREFLQAESNKDLKALQAKHKDAVPAE